MDKEAFLDNTDDEYVLNDVRLTPGQHALSEAVCRYLVVYVTRPLETAKLRLQSSTEVKGASEAVLEFLRGPPLGTGISDTWVAWFKSYLELAIKSFVLDFFSNVNNHRVTSRLVIYLYYLRGIICMSLAARLGTYPLELLKLVYSLNGGSNSVWQIFSDLRVTRAHLGWWGGVKYAALSTVISSLSSMAFLPAFKVFSGIMLFVPSLRPYRLLLAMYASKIACMFLAYPLETIRIRSLASKSAMLQSLRADEPADIYTNLWAGFSLHVASFVLKAVVNHFAATVVTTFQLWNNGYTMGIFDPRPIPGVPQYVPPNQLQFRLWQLNQFKREQFLSETPYVTQELS